MTVRKEFRQLNINMGHNAVAIIPARGGSKRIPRKNLVDLGGKPLIAYSIESAKKSKILGKNIFVSTEDAQIAETAKKYGARVIARSKILATDSAGTLDVLKEAVSTLEEAGVDFDTVVLLQATCPFRATATIDQGVKKLWNNWDKLKVIFSVRESKFPPNWLLRVKKNMLEFIIKNDFSKIRSQDLGKTYEIDGVVYVYKKDHLLKSEKYPFAPNKSGFVLTKKVEAIDIDDPEDLELARAIVSQRL